MKTFLTFICILLLVFSIGCSKQEATEPVAVPVEQPPAEPTAPVEPVAQEAQPVAPEQQPAAQPAPVPIVTGATALISNWSLEEQYVWESNQWVPGIVLDDGTATEIPPEPIIMEILGGVDSAWCPDVKQESGAEYITIVPGGCWKVTGNTMTEIDLPPEAGTGSMNWQIKDSKLEMDITFKDQSGTETNRNKAVLLALR